MSYRVYHDYDDDRDVITCGSWKKTIPVGARHCRRFMLVDGEY
jgi:hypothetical protein